MKGIATLKLRKPLSENIQNLYHENYEVIRCEYFLQKDVDKHGKVCGDIKAGSILVSLPILPTDNIMNWVFDTSKKYNGEITIQDAHSESLEKIYFEEGRPVKFQLHYEPGITNNIILSLTINVQQLVVGESEYTNTWR